MPLNYSSQKEVRPATSATVADVRRIIIELPRQDVVNPEVRTVSVLFEFLDGASNAVAKKSFTVAQKSIKTKYPVDFATVESILKKITYAEGVALGICPTGGTVV